MTNGMHVDPILFGIILATRELRNTLTLRRRDIITITFHLIGRPNCTRATGWRRDRWVEGRHTHGRWWGLISKWLGRI
jgi:hypothetical protein